MVISAPVNILVSILSGYFTAQNPFTFLYRCTVACVLISSYSVLVLLYFFPKDPQEQLSNFNMFHMVVVTLLNEISNCFHFTCLNAIVLVIADKRIAGMHITFMTSANNYCNFSHKFYLYRLADTFGIFMPQVVLSTIGVVVCLTMREQFCNLDNVPIKGWQVNTNLLRTTKDKTK